MTNVMRARAHTRLVALAMLRGSIHVIDVIDVFTTAALIAAGVKARAVHVVRLEAVPMHGPCAAGSIVGSDWVK